MRANFLRARPQQLQRNALPGARSFLAGFAIALGGALAVGSSDESPIRTSDVVTEQDRNFWAFTKPTRPEVPKVEDDARARTPIDYFILASLESKNLEFHDDAGNRTLMRRVSYNLTGLPPEPEVVEKFVNHPNPEAYNQLVDWLLDSPRYGERWGRHWLDVAGYSESSFFIGDQIRPDYWRYRDYVIRAFNADKPYDLFVLEQLAGDEMFDWRNVEAFTEDQKEKLIATGFLRTTPDATDNQPITQYEKIYATQQAVLEVSMKALMGLTLNCVRCHSHKYDPITHEDYYRMMALFQPAYDPEDWRAGIWTRHYPGPIRAIPLTPKADRDAFFKNSEEWRDKNFSYFRELRHELPQRWRDRFLQDNSEKIEDVSLRQRTMDILSRESQNRDDEEVAILIRAFEGMATNTDELKEMYPEFEKEEAELRSKMNELHTASETLPPLAWGAFDVTTSPSPTPLLVRGNFETPGDPVPPGVLTVLDDPEYPFDLDSLANGAPEYSTGRRLALARWMTDPDHPLTARVMVNRIWHYHFGEGLVRTPDDFGARGSRPTHPELLDWLAVEFIESGWSIKHMHRLILQSTVYRQSSDIEKAREEADPSNRLLNRFPKRRLEAEAIRDAMLAVSGQLDLKMYGESVPTERLEDGRVQIPADHPDRSRRSVYISTQRSGIPGFLTTFDTPIMDTNSPKRSASAIPQQALAAMNSPFVHESAAALSERVTIEGHESIEDRMNRIWMLAYSRYPEDDEVSIIRSWIGTKPNTKSSDYQETWKTISHSVLSSNEFIYID